MLRAGDIYGIAPGEDIGLGYPTVSLGTFYGQGVGGFVGSVAAGAILSAVPGAAVGRGRNAAPARATPPITVDPYPDYEGEVTPETHPELYEPPAYIPSPREVYDAAIGAVLDERPPVLIPVDADEDPYEPDRPEQEIPMPTFWDITSGVIDVIQGQQPGGYVPPAAGFAPPTSIPSDAARFGVGGDMDVCRGVRRRRRRRRLLTESDFNDLMRIATLPNKQNVTVALAKAVGRR